MRDRGDLKHTEAARFEIGAHQFGEVARLGHVDLVQRDELRALEERGLPLGYLVGAELG